MFSGLSRIKHWDSHTKQLANAHALYEYFQRYMDGVKKNDPNSPELTVTPLSLYIKILGEAGEYQRIFDVYYALDQTGPLSPNIFIFTAMFRALSQWGPPSTSSIDEKAIIDPQNAYDARLLWRQMLRASERPPGFSIDPYVISTAILALSRGRAVDQSFALDIVREYLGLTKPEQVAHVGKVPLTVQTLAAALFLCTQMRDHALCVHFFKLVKSRPERLGGASIIDRGHMEEVLKAYVAMATPGSGDEPYQTLEWMLRQEIKGPNGHKIRPAITTFNLVLKACWRSVDWPSATRTFELMTGYTAEHFDDRRDPSESPTLRKRSKGRNLIPNAETMSYMVQTALASHKPAYVRQSLRMVHHVGIEHLFHLTSGSNSTGDPRKKSSKPAVLHHIRLATALSEAIEQIRSPDRTRSADSAAFGELKARASEVLQSASEKLTMEDSVNTKGRQSPTFKTPAHSRRGRPNRNNLG
jgi:hypothetical protein